MWTITFSRTQHFAADQKRKSKQCALQTRQSSTIDISNKYTHDSKATTTQKYYVSYKRVSRVNCPTSLDSVPVKLSENRTLQHYYFCPYKSPRWCAKHQSQNTHIRVTRPSFEQSRPDPVQFSLTANRGQLLGEHPETMHLVSFNSIGPKQTKIQLL